jgi:competence protein ComEA
MKSITKLFLACALFLASQLSMAGPVDINTADVQTLAANIMGIGEKRAQAIIAFREEHGPFKSVDELTRVKGIGLKLVDKNRENLTISSQ